MKPKALITKWIGMFNTADAGNSEAVNSHALNTKPSSRQ